MPRDLFTTPLAPLLGTFLPFLSLDTVLATNPKAFLGVLKIPFLPYEVDFFNALIPLLTALLYAEDRLTPTMGAFKSAIADKVSLAPIPKSVKPCSNLIRSILPRSSAISSSCCPGCVCKASYPNAKPAAGPKAAEPTTGAAAPIKLLPATLAVPTAALPAKGPSLLTADTRVLPVKRLIAPNVAMSKPLSKTK